MRKDKHLAIQLRQQQKSYNEISRILNISKSTLSIWFQNNAESQRIKRALSDKNNKLVAERIKRFAKANKEKWLKWREDAKIQAKKDFNKLFKNKLFIAGLMLYWSEGDNKLGNPIRFTNTDSRMVALYVKFLIQILNIPKEKLRSTLILYSDLSEKNCIEFWTKITKMPKIQFYKTQFIKGRHPTKRLSKGICMISYSNRQLKEKMMVWIDLLSKKL